MRGLAALVAAGAVWVLVSGWAPVVRFPRIRLPAPWVLPASVSVGVVAGLLALGLLAVPAVAVAIGLLAASVPVGIEFARQQRRREALAAAWPDLLALMRGRVVAGATLPDAFIAAAERSPEPLRAAAGEVADSVTVGDGFAAALGRLRTELADATADRVLTTIIAAHRSGGSRVGLVLATLGTSVADELRLRRAHNAALTEQRMTAVVALLAPWALLSLTIATNPQSAEAYRANAGTVIVAVGFISTSLGYLLARRAAALAQAPRVFE